VDRVAAELAATGDVKADRAREVLARLGSAMLSDPTFPGRKRPGEESP
ncbi:MAG: hypothetical protein H0X17_22890, partial [Deltaproteobacteria bacterium]|nr:hypothetical protein [Deltaproteobacteria bacterium]